MFRKREKPRSLVLSILFTTIKVAIVCVLLGGAAAVGMVLGIAKAYIDTTPMLDLAALTDSNKTSYIYDTNGDIICTFAGSEYRDWVNSEDIPDMLKNAVIAVEDIRFREHNGVDYKRLVSAIVNTLRNEDTHGGSTITQQLIKNTILTNVQSYKRKIQEAYLALELETVSDKDSILEAYLNEVYFGDQNYGIKAAAKDYYGKELSELTIRECAMLAGMIQKPNGYNPRLNTYVRIDKETGENQMKRTNDRTDWVIRKMYAAGFINLEQRDKALSEEVSIVEKSTKAQGYDHAYFVEDVIYDVETHLLKQRGLPDTTANRAIVEAELRTGGYHIYLTIDPEIQDIVQNEVTNYNNYPSLKDSSQSIRREKNADGTYTEITEPQAAAVVLDHNTGELKAIVGGRNEPTAQKQWNRAYMSALEVGSSIKPIAVYGPALDKGLSPATPCYNIRGSIKGWNTEEGYPSLGNSASNVVTMRKGITSSLNVVAARTLMYEVGIDVSAKYLVNMGIPESHINKDGPGLALGTTGITPIQMAGAYATIANNGVYQEPLSFSRVVDSEGRIILDAKQIRVTRRVYKETTSWLLVNMMEDVVDHGTGTRARLHNMTVAGKTGTNSDYSSVCFSGMTGYYVGTVWIGHDYPQYKLAHSATGGTYAAPLWKNFMEKIHEGKNDIPITDLSPDSLGLVKKTVCAVSGLLATQACEADKDHPPVTDYFDKENVPEDECTMHIPCLMCADSDYPASPSCTSVYNGSVIMVDTDSPLYQFKERYLREIFKNIALNGIVELCPVHSGGTGTVSAPTEPTESPSPSQPPVNSPSPTPSPKPSESPTPNPYQQIIDNANHAVNVVEKYLNTYGSSLSDTDRMTLEADIQYVKLALKAEMYSKVAESTDKLARDFERITGNSI